MICKSIFKEWQWLGMCGNSVRALCGTFLGSAPEGREAGNGHTVGDRQKPTQDLGRSSNLTST
jgi:hypothetical protein